MVWNYQSGNDYSWLNNKKLENNTDKYRIKQINIELLFIARDYNNIREIDKDELS